MVRKTSAVLAGLLVVLVGLTATGCFKKKKSQQVSYVDARAQYRRAVEELGDDRLNQAKEILQSIQYTADDDRREIEPLVRLAMADATFYEGNGLALIDARNLYLDFVTLYGDHPLAPYAQFQAGICSLEQVVNPAKDQTMTFQAVDDMRVVERRWPDSRYAYAARKMRALAGDNLADHDYQVGRFYMKRKGFIAAADRFRSVLERFPEYKKADRVYLWLGRALLKMDSEAEARVYLDKLITDYPDGELAREAQKFLDQAGGKLDMDLQPSR